MTQATYGPLDILPDILLPDHNKQPLRLSIDMTGKALLLVFAAGLEEPTAKGLLDAICKDFTALSGRLHVYAVTSASPEANARRLATLDLPFPVLSDLNRQVAQGLGVAHNLDGRDGATLLLADANRRIIELREVRPGEDATALIAETLDQQPGPQARELGRFAPVLYLRQVLEPSVCRQLIQAYLSGAPEEGRVYEVDRTTGQGSHLVDRSFKSRQDVFLTDPALVAIVKQAIARRVAPEIHKALTREIVGVEEFQLACYRAQEAGHFSAHRDNVSERHAHRRFAMTLNLNREDYEGGALRFPEYGPDLYNPDTGDAVIFSCSLMHEATAVTKGERYVLIGFLFDEESRRLNQRYGASGGATRT